VSQVAATLKTGLSVCLSELPQFRGKGRITLLLDRLLTDYQNPASYEVTGTLNNGVRFRFDLRPWGQRFAYYYREWEAEYVEALRRLYQGGTFLDIGSSLGLYVVCLGEKVREKAGSIVSVEPVPFNLERQKKNVALNEFEDLVSYWPFALGDRKTRVRISTDPMRADNNAIIATEGDFEIDICPLDELPIVELAAPITLIKMDVEGYEPMVIEGARATIAAQRPVIFGEFSRERLDINGFSMEQTWQFLVGELQYVCYRLDLVDNRFDRIEEPGSHQNIFLIPRETKVPADLIR
jgi:FkbM family methyltransferase